MALPYFIFQLIIIFLLELRFIRFIFFKSIIIKILQPIQDQFLYLYASADEFSDCFAANIIAPADIQLFQIY